MPDMSEPRRLSSSISMFIEDSRVAAVVNGDANPVNPGQFYTAGVVRNVCCSDSRYSSPEIPASRPTTLDLLMPIERRTVSYFEQNDQHLVRRKPREIIHKIVREDGCEEARKSCNVKSSDRNPSTLNNGSQNVPTDQQKSKSYRSQSVTVSVYPQGRWTRKGSSIEPNVHHLDSNSVAANGKKRAVTSVNLILRSPTQTPNSPSAPQCHYTCRTSFVTPGVSSSYIRTPQRETDSEGNAHNESSVTYSSYSNCDHGYESQLKIRIGPQGGSICATRLRGNRQQSRNRVSSPGTYKGSQKMNPVTSPGDFQEMKDQLLATQLERHSKLTEALRDEEKRFAMLLASYHALRLRCKPCNPEMERLKNQNQFLELECQLMTQQIDMLNDRVPLGETNESFYRQINPGQDIPRNMGYDSPTSPTEEVGRWPTGSLRKPPPPRPPPPNFLKISGPVEESMPWNCSLCTFQNHPAMIKCEQCEMSRVPSSRHCHNIRVQFSRRSNPTADMENDPRQGIITSWAV